MKQLPSQTVSITGLQMRQLDASDLQKLGMNFFKQQPEGYTYIVDKGESPSFNQDERDFLLYQGIVIWQMVKKALAKDSQPRQLSLFEFEEYEMLNQMLLGELEDYAWTDALVRLKELSETHVQPEIMRYLIDTVENDPNEAQVSDKNKLLLVRYLITLLDALCDQE